MLAIEVENVVKEFPGGWRRPPRCIAGRCHRDCQCVSPYIM